MGQLQQLYKLQQIDTEIREKMDRLKKVLAAQKENVALQQARKEVETAVSDRQSAESQHKKASRAVDDLQRESKNCENRLYSGNVTNPKELVDLQNKIASLGRRNEVLEENLLEAMILVEEAQTAKTTGEALVAKLVAAWKIETTSLKKEQNELALRLHSLGVMKKEVLPTISTEALAEYKYLLERKRGTAVSKLRVNQCLACQLTVPAQKVKSAREGVLTHCGGCGRILCPA